MHKLRLSTFLTPAMIALTATPALAATTISSSTTAPLATSGAGDVTVASGGTITVSGSPAVTVDSSNSVTVESGGTLTASASNNSGGILVSAGTTSTIDNAGIISAVESYTAGLVTGTSTASGPIANTTGRYGIFVQGAASGSLTNSGTIAVKGLNSAAILLAGTYTGAISNTGAISVIGDGSTGLKTGTVNGDVTLGGSIIAAGQGAQAAVFGGAINGALSIQGTISQASSYTTDSSTTQTLSKTALGGGTPAVEVDGNVTGGIQVYALCTVTTVSSVDSCTSTGTATGTGTITSYGNGPALQIGGASDITVSGSAASIDGNSYALAVDGSISANGTYSGLDANAVVIGGRGGSVTLSKGIGVTGTITATSVDSTATAVLVNAGSSVTSLTNSGTIKGVVSQAGGTAAYGVRDLSGTLTAVTNHGVISATGGATSAAIDLSANTTGVTYTQGLTAYEQAEQTAEQAASTYSAASAAVYTSTLGDILTGSGNDLVSIQSGTVTGNAWLGGGTDQVALSGDAKWTGDLHFDAGTGKITLAGSSALVGGLYLADQPTTLTIADTAAFYGTGITGGSNLAVTVNGGSFGAASATTLSLNALTVNAGGVLRTYIDGTTGTSSLIDATTATFASGAKVSAAVSSLANVEGTYRILTAGTLVGNPTFDATTTVLPVLFKGSVDVSGNDLYLTLARKTATDLGLTTSEAAGYDAIYANALLNSTLATSLLESSDGAALQGQFDQLLPDHSGGVFDFVTRGSRLATRHLTDDSSLFSISDVGGWFEPIYFKGSKYATGTADWRDDGFGLSGGMERKTGIGNIGASLAWFTGKVHDGSWQDIKADTIDLGVFWRMSKGPFYAFAKLGADRVSLNSTRTFTGAVSGAALTYVATGHWTGWAVTGDAGASYRLALPGNFSLKPMATLEYFRLHENGYAESGASAIDLAVNSRTSEAFNATTTLTAGWSMGRSSQDGRPLTIELEGGRRNHVSGQLGSTTASFTGGTAFTITPDALKGGWLGEARLLFGGIDYTWQLTGAAEQTLGKTDMSVRASLSMAF